MAPLSDIVVVNITAQVGGLTQQGFGTPLILGYTPTWVERVRYYSDLAGIATDLGSTSPEYKCAQAVFGQTPRPERLAIGRGSSKPTQRYKLSIVSVVSSKDYTVRLNGTDYTINSGVGATNDSIAGAINTAISAACTAAGFTSSVIGAVGSQQVQVLGNAAGNWCSFGLANAGALPYLKVMQDHADPGIGADLDAILLEDTQWYALLTMFNSSACVQAAATWTQANERLYLAETQDSEVPTVSVGAATDVAKVLSVAGSERAPLIYHPIGQEFAAAAWAGRVLPLTPGSEAWKFKTLSGVSAQSYTTTHLTNCRNKRANFYYSIAGRSITSEGTTPSTSLPFVDIVRFRDWLRVRLQENLFLLLANADKVSFDDVGITKVLGVIRGVLEEARSNGAITPDFTVSVPKAASVNPVDKANRELKNVTFSVTYTGAVHKVVINGVITL